MRYPAKIGGLGLALAAVLLLGAIAAGTASAAKFEAKPGFPVKFSGEGKVGLLETKGGHSVTCLRAEASGEVSGEHAVANVSVAFKECAAEHLAPQALPCSSGTVSGEIVTKPIAGEPVDLDPLHAQAGLLLRPQSGEVFAEFVCQSTSPSIPVKETLKVTGSLIGQVKTTDLNEFRKTLDLEFVQGSGIQAWRQIEATGAEHTLMTEGTGTAPFAAEQSAVGEAAPGTTTTTALGGAEIKLVP